MWTFRPVEQQDRPLVHAWLHTPHASEWFYGQGLQNTIDHLDLFLKGNPTIFKYWLACDGDKPFGFFITTKVEKGDEVSRWTTGKVDAITLDVLIGETDYMGKGFGHQLIREFLNDKFPYTKEILIDPDKTNTRAIRVYEKAGFKTIGEFDICLMMRLEL